MMGNTVYKHTNKYKLELLFPILSFHKALPSHFHPTTTQLAGIAAVLELDEPLLHELFISVTQITLICTS